MKAIILAAGKSRGLAGEVPVSLVEVCGKKIIDWQLEALRECGITEILLVVGYKQEMLKEYLGNRVQFLENDNYDQTRSAYSLWKAWNFCQDGFLYLNGDLLFEAEILKKVLDSKYENVFAFDRKYDFTSDMHKVVMIGDRIIHHNHKVSHDIAHGEAVGPVKVSKEFAAEVLHCTNNDINCGNEKNTVYNVFNDVAKYLPMHGVNITGLRWSEVDTKEDLMMAQRVFGAKTPFVVMMYGYPATGKTTMSRALQEYCSQFSRTALLSTFNLREELGLVDLYSKDEREAIYGEMMERVSTVMKWKKSNIILDGNFNLYEARKCIYDAARLHGYQVFVVHCRVAEEQEITRRLHERAKRESKSVEHGATSVELYDLIRKSAESLERDVSEVAGMNVVHVDTHKDLVSVGHIGLMSENVGMIQNGIKFGLVKQ